MPVKETGVGLVVGKVVSGVIHTVVLLSIMPQAKNSNGFASLQGFTALSCGHHMQRPNEPVVTQIAHIVASLQFCA